MQRDSGGTSSPLMDCPETASGVLIVDDQAPTRNILCIALEGMGFETVSVGSAEAALETLRASPRPALIIVDVRLPGMSGLELVQHVRTEGCDVPMVLVSAYGRPRRHPADAFLAKPFRLETLESMVAQLTHREEPLGGGY